MKAAVLYGVKDIRIEEWADPKIADDEVLIRIVACGICPSDLRIYIGLREPRKFPIVLGHEWVGYVVNVGDKVRSFKEGDRVVADWRVVCGRCYYCRRGIFNYCLNLQVNRVQGGFCEYGKAPESNLRIIPSKVAYEEAIFTEPLACCINGITRSNINPGDDVVIIGAGPIGLMHLQLAKHLGARVIVSDPIKDRLKVAKNLGADEVVCPAEEDPVDRVKSLTDGRGATAVIVAVGGGAPVKQAIDMAATCGVVNIFAGTYPSTEIPLDPNLIHYKQLTLTGSRDFTPHHFTTALKLMELGIVKVKPLISHILPLEKIDEGFRIVEKSEGLKVVIKT